MEKLTELKHGLEDTWHSLSHGWHQLVDRTSGALTRFTPTSTNKPETEPTSFADSASSKWALLAGDVFEDADKFIVRLEMPGLDKQHLDIEVRSDVLIVRGEKHLEHESTSGQYRVRQCAFGSFHRSIPLPVPVQTEKAQAHYHRGVLRIELPKAAHARGRRIEVRDN